MRKRVWLTAVLAATTVLLPACGNPDKNASDAAGVGPTHATTPSATDVGTKSAIATEDGTQPGRSPSPNVKDKMTSPKPQTARTRAAPLPPPQEPPRFGAVPTPPGSSYDASVASDGQTLTIRFSDLQVGVGGEPEPARPTQRFSIVLPITGEAKGAVVDLFFAGYAFTDDRTTARLTVWANDQMLAKTFPRRSDGEFVQSLAVRLRSTTECRITVQIEVNEELNSPDASAYLNVSTIDARFS